MDLTVSVDGVSVSILGTMAVGSAVGLFAGMFGVGGAFLLVPLLHVALGLPLPIAVGLALCQTIATALGSFLRYRELGQAELRFDVLLMGGGLLGIDAGTRVLIALEDVTPFRLFGQTISALATVSTALFTALFLIIGALLWFRPDRQASVPGDAAPLSRIPIPPYVELPTVGLERVSAPVVAYVGFLNGMLGGLIGVSGGILLIPVMLYGFGFDLRKAAGTGILVVLVVAVMGTVEHARLGHVPLVLAIPLVIASGLAAQVGVGLTQSLPPVFLRRGLALVLIGLTVVLIFKLFS